MTKTKPFNRNRLEGDTFHSKGIMLKPEHIGKLRYLAYKTRDTHNLIIAKALEGYFNKMLKVYLGYEGE